MRYHVRLKSYGTRLVEEFIADLSGEYVEAQLKVLRVDLLTASKCRERAIKPAGEPSAA
jgi:hypothetical protein